MQLPDENLSKVDEDLARRFAPILLLDKYEPFRPQVIGVTVAQSPMPSASFPRILEPPAGGFVIEYAFWWDWDISHLYELEHIWVIGTQAGGVPVITAVEGSTHGGSRLLHPEYRDTHPVVCCEPGKHAFFVPGSEPSLHPRTLTLLCREWAGCGGLLGRAVAPGSLPLRYRPPNRRIAGGLLQQRAFTPSFEFTTEIATEELPLRTWPSVAAWIPGRIKDLLNAARKAPSPPPRHGAVKSSLLGVPAGEIQQHEFTLVEEPAPVAGSSRANRIEWAAAQIRTARKQGIRLILQMTGSVSAPLVGELEEIINGFGLSQSMILLLPAGTAPPEAGTDSDLALGYTVHHEELDPQVFRMAVLSGVEYVFAPSGYASIPQKTRDTCAELGFSWIMLSHDDSVLGGQEAISIVLDRGRQLLCSYFCRPCLKSSRPFRI